MSVTNTIALFTCAILAVCDARFVDTLSKCSVTDADCLKVSIASQLEQMKNTGISEFGIPPADPYMFKDIKISVLDLLDMTAIEGQVNGISNCVVDSYEADVEKGQTDLGLTCSNLEAIAKYTLSASNSLTKELLKGQSVQGDGNGKIKIEKVKINFHFSYDVVRNKDGDISLEIKIAQSNYDYEIMGKVTFDADKLYVGETDATQPILEYMNNNYKVIVDNFGGAIADKVAAQFYQYLETFFQSVPTKYFILEDLSKYVKN